MYRYSMVVALCLLSFISFAEKATKTMTDLNMFTTVSLKIEATLIVENGKSEEIVIEADQKDIDKIDIQIKEGELIIKELNKNPFKPWRANPIKITVKLPEVHKLLVNGSGEILSKETIDTRILTIYMQGSGNINLQSVESEQVNATISGSGDITLASKNGNAKNIEVSIFGSGDVEADDFEVEFAQVEITGSGDCKLNVTEKISGKISGSGDIKYKNEPAIGVKIMGSGNVTSLEY